MKSFLLIAAMAALSIALPAAAAEPAPSGRFLAQVIGTSKPHRDAVASLLKGRRGLPSWVRNMISRGDYVAAASQAIVVDGTSRELFSVCQPKNCASSQFKVLFSADGRKAVVRIADTRLGEQFLGDPDASEKAAMMKPGL
ncbi:MAG: Ivy family c-type lysozyme inhibitor [Allorhizobium sp.]